MPRARPGRRAGRGQAAGQEAVEFALLLPLLLLILFGVLDLGRILHAAITLANAAREGARYGLMFPADEAGIEQAVINEAAGSGIDLADPAVATITKLCPLGETDGACNSGTPVRVEVVYQFELILALVFDGPTLPVSSYAEMMVP